MWVECRLVERRPRRPRFRHRPGLPAFDAEQQLPPNDVGSLRELYDPALAKLGVRMTRAELIDITDSRYVPSNDGRHLAMYVEPIADYTDEQYVNGFWTVSALITPDVFERWPELESYDICQEPLPRSTTGPSPSRSRRSTSLERRRRRSIGKRRSRRSARGLATNPDLTIVVNRAIRQTPTYMAADAAARTKAGLNPAPGARTFDSAADRPPAALTTEPVLHRCGDGLVLISRVMAAGQPDLGDRPGNGLHRLVELGGAAEGIALT